jgi:hypothetical protein
MAVKKICRRFILPVIILLVTPALQPSRAFAQEKEVQRSWGLSASLQGGQSALVVPLWLGPKFVVAPNASVNHIDNVGTILGVGLALRLYQGTGRLMPYWGVRGGSTITMPSGGGSSSSNGAGVFYGGEFFINPRFSFAVEGQVNSVLTSPLTVATATALMATVHF